MSTFRPLALKLMLKEWAQYSLYLLLFIFFHLFLIFFHFYILILLVKHFICVHPLTLFDRSVIILFLSITSYYKIINIHLQSNQLQHEAIQYHVMDSYACSNSKTIVILVFTLSLLMSVHFPITEAYKYTYLFVIKCFCLQYFFQVFICYRNK